MQPSAVDGIGVEGVRSAPPQGEIVDYLYQMLDPSYHVCSASSILQTAPKDHRIESLNHSLSPGRVVSIPRCNSGMGQSTAHMWINQNGTVRDTHLHRILSTANSPNTVQILATQTNSTAK
eukprot:GHVN01042842.1.p1 GENE.GHVN01042842.1~~GHVN01042842.1.p1  ORF type:complete len:132 (+),score=21.60 GHVN01042842.1:35-397(+)